MKRRFRVISVIVAATLIASSLAGCQNNNETNVNAEVKEQEKRNIKPEVSFTEYDFIKGGVSDYIILIPAAPTENEDFSASELQYFLKMATEIEFEIKRESDQVPEHYISVGATVVSDNASVNPSFDEVKTNGFVMKTVEDDIYLKGYGDIGTRNSIYEFLYYCFDYECYTKDEIYIKGTSNLKLPDLASTIVPSFDWRNANNGENVFDKVSAYRMKLNHNDEKYVTGGVCHNTFDIIDPKVYSPEMEQYKSWFSEEKTQNPLLGIVADTPAQLCFSNEAMTEEFIKNLIPKLVESEAPLYLIGMEDNINWCTCEACTASKEKYGTDAAVMIKFTNKVQRAVNEYFAENLPDREPTHMVFFAYYCTVKPPVKLNETTGKYEPIDESVILDDEVGILYAPINAYFAVPLTNEVNKEYAEYIEGWSALTNNIHIWIYNLHTADAMILHNTCESMQENYKFLYDYNCVGIVDQVDSYQSTGNTSWMRARAYVSAKIRWDINLNTDELYRDFFEHYFDDAADTMYDIFMEEREWITYAYKSTGLNGKISERMNTSEFWSFPMLVEVMEKFDKAYEEIQTCRESDAERYQKLYDRILLESMQFRFILIEAFSTEFSAKELKDMKLSFKEDFEYLGLKSYAEGYKISTLWSNWGI